MSVRGTLTLSLALLAASLVASAEEGANRVVAGIPHLHEEQSATNWTTAKGATCEYGGSWYAVGESVPTEEPCLVCTCTRASLVCHLRVCPAVPNSVPQGCYKLQKAGKCCPQVVCDGELESNKLYREEARTGLAAAEIRRQHVEIKAAMEEAEKAVEGTRRRWGYGEGPVSTTTSTSSTTTTTSTTTYAPVTKGCEQDGAVFAEGSAMMSPDKCSYCFCIHGSRRCVTPKCLLPVDGCRPRYRSFSCCPSFYDCHPFYTSVADTTNTTLTTTTTTTIARDSPPDPATAPAAASPVPAAKTLTEEDDALTLAAEKYQNPVDSPREDFQRRTGRMLEGEEVNVEEEEQEASAHSTNEGVEEEEESSAVTDVNLENVDTQDSTETPPSEEAEPTQKPPPRLRPMSRPSLAEIAKRRQESRFKSRQPSPASLSPRISRPSRPQQRQNTPVSPTLSYRYKNRTQPQPKATESTSTTATPSTTATAAPKASSTTTTTTTETTESRFKPKSPLKLNRFTREPTTTTSTTTATDTAADTLISNTPSTTTNTTITIQGPDISPIPASITAQEPNRALKDSKLRWNKFRFHSTISSASRPTRPTRRPAAGFIIPSTTSTTTRSLEEAPSEVTGRGEVDKVHLLQDGTKLRLDAPPSASRPDHPLRARPFSYNQRSQFFNRERPKEVFPEGTHIFGPVLSIGQGVRNERQTRDRITTKEDQEGQTEAFTDVLPEDTTITPLETLAVEVETEAKEETVTIQSLPEDTQTVLLEDEEEEEEATTVSPVISEITLNPQKSSPTIAMPSTTTTSTTTTTTTTTNMENPPPPSPAEGEPSISRSEEPPATPSPVENPPLVPLEEEIVDTEYGDGEPELPIYDITVGTSVMTAGHAQRHSPVGVGQVIPVELRPEDLMPHPEGAIHPEEQDIPAEPPQVHGTVIDADVNETEAAPETFQNEGGNEVPKTTEEGTLVPGEKTIVPEETLAPEHKGVEEGEDEDLKTTDVLEAENKAPTTTPPPGPSEIFGALIDFLTRTPRPRPESPIRQPPSRYDRPRPDRFRERPGAQLAARPRPERPRLPRPRPGLRPLKPELSKPQEPEEPRPEEEGAEEAGPNIAAEAQNDETATGDLQHESKLTDPKPLSHSLDQPEQDQTTPSAAGPEDQLGPEEGDPEQHETADHPRPFRPRPELPPARRPFRPRPRPADRPDFIPPRFRFTPSPLSSSPSPLLEAGEEVKEEPVEDVKTKEVDYVDTIHEGVEKFPHSPDLLPPPPPPPPSSSLSSFLPPPHPPPPSFSTLPPPPPSSPSPIQDQKEPISIIPDTRPPLFFPPPTPKKEAPSLGPIFTFLHTADEETDLPGETPIAVFDLPDPIHTIARHPFIPQPVSSPVHTPPVASESHLPSEPVLEGGFLGIQEEGERERIHPTFELPDDYDNEGEPTLPPSLPNLKIIPFVAADALTSPHHSFSPEDLVTTARPNLLAPFLLPDRDHEGEKDPNLKRDDVTEQPAAAVTVTPTTTPSTTTTTTTTEFPTIVPRRTLPRRPPIVPSRRPASDEVSARRPFLPFRRPGERPNRPTFGASPSSDTEEPREEVEEEEEDSTSRVNQFSLHDHTSSRFSSTPPRFSTIEITPPETTESPTSSTRLISLPPRQTPPPPSRPPSPPLTSFFPRTKPTTTLPTQTSRPIFSNDISDLLLKNVFGLSGPQGVSAVRYTSSQGTPKPIVPVKVLPTLPEIPDAVKDQLPLATDPVLASGLLKLSGCNIYGRMYVVKDKIPELSGKCKECRCTPVGVQCLPVC